MSDTANFALPFLAAAQSQKHVTVNEAFAQMDGLLVRQVQSSSLSLPPASPLEGQSWIIAQGAQGDWAGHDMDRAVFLEGGWKFYTPLPGDILWDSAAACEILFNGTSWRALGVELGVGGAQTVSEVLSFTHILTAGASSASVTPIPSHSAVIGVTTRVIQAITGAGTTGFQVGVAGSANRYGSGIGIGLNAWSNGMTGQPVTYYGDEPVLFTAEGGDFIAGEIAVGVHLTRLIPPDAV